MTTLDLHPEDLLDKEEDGALTPEEAERLAVHMAQCATCRFERAARADFRAELDAPVAAEDLPLLAGAIARAAAEKPAAPLPTPEPSPTPAPNVTEIRPRRARRAMLLVAAAALLLASGAAAFSREMRSHAAALFTSPEDALVSTPALTVPKAHGETHRAAPPPIDEAPAVNDDAPAPRPEPAASSPMAPPLPSAPVPSAPLASARMAPARVARAALPSASSPIVPTSIAAPEAAAPAPHADAPRASSLFAEANEARARRDVPHAVALYRDLQRSFPESAEAQVSRVTVGRLLLDGDPASALASFDAYLAARSGGLVEEAMVGRALALEALGRRREETSAWAALLAVYPDSPHAPHARARLESSSER